MTTYDLISAKKRFKNQIADGAKRMGITLEFRLASGERGGPVVTPHS